MLKNIVLCMMIIAIFVGCATTGNPKEGGIFWSEKKAKVRQQELRNSLEDEQRRGQALKEETADLENQRNAKQAELNRQRALLSSLDAELDSMRKKIHRYRANTVAKQKEKHRLEAEILTLNDKIYALQKDTKLSVEERKRKIDILNKEVDDLLAIVSAL